MFRDYNHPSNLEKSKRWKHSPAHKQNGSYELDVYGGENRSCDADLKSDIRKNVQDHSLSGGPFQII